MLVPFPGFLCYSSVRRPSSRVGPNPKTDAAWAPRRHSHGTAVAGLAVHGAQLQRVWNAEQRPFTATRLCQLSAAAQVGNMHESVVLVVVRLWILTSVDASTIEGTLRWIRNFGVLNCYVEYPSNSVSLCVHIERRLHAPLLWATGDARASTTEVAINEGGSERVTERTSVKMFKKL